MPALNHRRIPRHPRSQKEIAALVLSVDRLAWAVANCFSRSLPEDVREDLHAAGMIGAVEAAQAFDKARGVKFSTYARAWIFAYVARQANHFRGRGCIPLGARAPWKALVNASRVARRFAVAGQVLSREELAAHVGVPAEILAAARAATSSVSFDGDEGNDWKDGDEHGVRPLSEVIPSSDPGPDETSDHDAVAAALADLPSKARFVILQRLRGRTGKAIGEDLGCSRQRVEQIIGEAVVALRAALA